jgi:hypothetical protein
VFIVYSQTSSPHLWNGRNCSLSVDTTHEARDWDSQTRSPGTGVVPKTDELNTLQPEATPRLYTISGSSVRYETAYQPNGGHCRLQSCQLPDHLCASEALSLIMPTIASPSSGVIARSGARNA